MTTIEICSVYACASQVAQLVKNPPAIVGDLGSIPGLGRFPAEGKGYLLQYFSLSHRILQDTENIVSEYWEYSSEYWAPGQRIPWTVLSSPWVTKTRTQLSNFHFGKGNGNPLQYSCLENPMDRGAWQATIHGVAKSETRLKTRTEIWD